MIVGVLKEPPFESRVSLLAESAAALAKKGIEVRVESGAGDKAFCSDEDYQKAGASIVRRAELLAQSDVLLLIHPDEILNDLQNKILIGVYQPLYHPDRM